MKPAQLTRLQLSFPAQEEDLLTGLLYLHVPWGWQDDGLDHGLRMLTIHCDQPEQCAEIQALLAQACPSLQTKVDHVPNADWASAWKKYFVPINIGRFVVLPSWLAQGETKAEPIVIEPKMAFGTGHHQTTALCLTALDHLATQGCCSHGQSFLDLGTGSGILAIAAAKLGLKGWAVDIDSIAMDNARENVVLNAVQSQIHLETGSLEILSYDQSFDLILANILANPLMDMAQGIIDHLAPSGILVLSGILLSQADQVAQAYTDLGLPEPELTSAQEWACLIFKR